MNLFRGINMNDIELELNEIACEAGISYNWTDIPGVNETIANDLNKIGKSAVREISDYSYYLNSLNNGYVYQIKDISTPTERFINIERYVIASAICKTIKINPVVK
jgi:hypothetical protein